MPVRPRFDPSREFVAGRGFTFNGSSHLKGQPFAKEGVVERKLRIMYDTRMLNFAPDAAAQAEPAPEALDQRVAMESTGGGWFAITAPWLDQPIKVQGKDPAAQKLRELQLAGEPLDHHGVALTPGDNGWWTVKAEWAEPEQAHGEEAARLRADELRAEGPPQDPVTVAPGAVMGEAEGRFVVTAVWAADDPEVFDTVEEAEARAAELREAGPPEGQEPPAPTE